MAVAALMQTVCNTMNGAKATLLMVLAQVIFASLNILTKMVANDGMSLYVLAAYRFMLAAAVMVPIALIFERKNRPKLTWKLVGLIFISGLIGGALGLNLYIESIKLTSPTYISAMTNLIPSVTFVLAICFRMEKLRLETMAGKAKVAGLLLGIAGAMLLTFYKGDEINLWSRHINLSKTRQHSVGSHAAHHKSSDQILGAIFAICGCICYGSWVIIQGKIAKDYPAHYTSTALMTSMAAIQAMVYALCREKDWSQWKLQAGIRLFTVLYVGLVASGLIIIITSLCVSMKGPLFTSSFNPLQIVFVALTGSLILNEKLHLGSIIGSVVIVLGLYFVIWGKNKEMKILKRQLPTSSFDAGQSLDISHGIETVISPSKVNIDPEEIEDNGLLRTRI